MVTYARGSIGGSAFDIASQRFDGEKKVLSSEVLVSPKCLRAACSSPLILSENFSEVFQKIKKKSNHYTRRITPKRVTSCGAHLRGLAPGLHCSEETSQWWRAVGDTGSVIEPRTSRTDVINNRTNLTE